MGNNDGIVILGALGLFYLITRKGNRETRSVAGGSRYIYTYEPHIQSEQGFEPSEPLKGSNIPRNLRGFKSPAKAIKYAPKGAGVVLHGTGSRAGGYQIR